MHRDNKFGDSGVAWYVIRVRDNESSKHAFLCWVLEEELFKAGFKVGVQVNSNPDIIAEKKGKKYAFEVETGSALSSKTPEYLENRFQQMKKEYDETFVLVANYLLVNKYKYFAPAITRSQIRQAITDLLSREGEKRKK